MVMVMTVVVVMVDTDGDGDRVSRFEMKACCTRVQGEDLKTLKNFCAVHGIVIIHGPWVYGHHHHHLHHCFQVTKS